MYQAEVIRSALALKLHCYEDTGAIVAAMTTSIPEAPGSGRTWDYRYCWLRDAYYTLGALRRIGHFEEREQFLSFLVNLAAKEPKLGLAPLYRIDGALDLDEAVLDQWAGYENEGPVRIGNAASLHEQHDIFGEMVLALAPIYFDDRYGGERSVHTLDLMERLTRRAIEVAGTPDAGIWEYRSDWRPQTFSSLMCWAAADRMATIAERFGMPSGGEYRSAADRIRDEVCAKAYDAELGSFVASYGTKELDAALLQMVSLRFLPCSDPRVIGTVRAVQSALDHEGWLRRYASDGMGNSEVAFTICTFWFVEALARIGAREEARVVFERTLKALSPLGLIAEDYDPKRRRMWGNFPQAYSHVGLIHAAFSASPAWHEVL
jgi:GH15 family glucan-1,4-alpha-glucosidase